MSLLSLAKKQKRQEEAAAKKERIERELAYERRLKEAAEAKHRRYLKLKSIIEEKGIQVVEEQTGWAIASVRKGDKVLGYFHEYEDSGSDYVSDYGCEVGWSVHKLIFGGCTQHIERNTPVYFEIDLEPGYQRLTDEEFEKELAESMVAFYKRQRLV